MPRIVTVAARVRQQDMAIDTTMLVPGVGIEPT